MLANVFVTSLTAIPKGQDRINILSYAVKSCKVLYENNGKGLDIMKSLLKQFAYGNISADEHYFKHDSEYVMAMSDLNRIEEKMPAHLDDEGKALFKEMIDAKNRIQDITAVNSFAYGYKVGLLMTAEAFCASDNVSLNTAV